MFVDLHTDATVNDKGFVATYAIIGEYIPGTKVRLIWEFRSLYLHMK